MKTLLILSMLMIGAFAFGQGFSLQFEDKKEDFKEKESIYLTLIQQTDDGQIHRFKISGDMVRCEESNIILDLDQIKHKILKKNNHSVAGGETFKILDDGHISIPFTAIHTILKSTKSARFINSLGFISFMASIGTLSAASVIDEDQLKPVFILAASEFALSVVCVQIARMINKTYHVTNCVDGTKVWKIVPSN